MIHSAAPFYNQALQPLRRCSSGASLTAGIDGMAELPLGSARFRRSPSGTGPTGVDGMTDLALSSARFRQSLSGVEGVPELALGSARLKRSPSGGALTAVRTARAVTSQLEQISQDRLGDVERALAVLQEAGVHEVADVKGLRDAVAARLAHEHGANTEMNKNITVSPFLEKGLSFNFTQMETLMDTCEVGRSLFGLKSLSTLKLSFNRCTNLTDLRNLGIGISQLGSLTDVDIDFSNCVSLATLDGLGEGIERLTSLQKLSLSFQGCVNLQSGSELGRGIKPLLGLQTLFLSFEGCNQLHTDTAVSVGSAVSQLPNLINLDLDVCGSKVRRGATRPTILETGPLGITNYIISSSL